jgi:hypothetical protein
LLSGKKEEAFFQNFATVVELQLSQAFQQHQAHPIPIPMSWKQFNVQIGV